MNHVIFFARKAFRASLVVALERCLHRVELSDVIVHLVLLVKASRAERANIFCSNVNVVCVIEQVRLKTEAETAVVADVSLGLFRRLRVIEMLLLVIPQRNHRRQNLAADCAGMFLPVLRWMIRVLVASVEIQIFLNLELFSAQLARQQLVFGNKFVLYSDVIAQSLVGGERKATFTSVDLPSTSWFTWCVRLPRSLRRNDEIFFVVPWNFCVLFIDLVKCFNCCVIELNQFIDIFFDYRERLRLRNFPYFHFSVANLFAEKSISDESNFLEFCSVVHIRYTFWTHESWLHNCFTNLK